MKKRIVSILLAVMTVSVLAGCGSNATKSADVAMNVMSNSGAESEIRACDYTEAMAAEECYDSLEYSDEATGVMESEADTESTKASDANSESLKYEDKLVYEANVVVETMDFDKTYADLLKLIEANGGRIENEQYDATNTSYSYNYMDYSGFQTTKIDNLVIRIPSSNYKVFMDADTELGNVISKQQSLTNITQTYYDTTTRKELLEGQLEYYKHQLELIEEKMMDCEDYEYVISQMVELEDRIVNVQNQINICTSDVKTMDMQVTYSTVYLTINEVKEYTEIIPVVEEDDSFGARLVETVKNSALKFVEILEGILLAIITMLPYLIVIAAFVFVIILIVKSILKAKGKAKARKAAANANEIIKEREENKEQDVTKNE